MNRFLGLRQVLIAALCILVAIVFVVVFTHQQPAAPSNQVVTGNPLAREQYWALRIEVAGPVQAYTEFAQAVVPLSPNQQHENAHAFGAALYDVEGLSGLATCDAQFNYGCYHEFLGRAIAKEGLGVVNELNDGCVKALKSSALSCQHGIGHGIEAALGYDTKALLEALAVCKDLPFNDPIGGCYGGVFMEYNMQTMLGDEGRTRPIMGGNWHYPCDELAADYQAACAFWSPQWWLNLQHQGKGATTSDFAALGKLCDETGSAALVRDCYEGMGTIVPPEAEFDPVKTADLCTESSHSPLHQLYCKSYAANAISVGGAWQVGNGTKVCDGLTGEYLKYCVAYGKNQANLAQTLPSPAE